MKHLDFFQRHIQRLKMSANGQAEGICPFHEDRNPSFSCDVEKGLWTCHGGCGSGNAYQFAERLGVDPPDEKNSGQSRLSEVARYTYEDETGKPIYQVRRYFPKTFRQFRSDENGGWISGLKGTRPVLYHLTEVLSATEVYVPEGEKDVETVRSWGLTATTNSGGAGKWRAEYSDALKNKLVVITPDRDTAGEQHAKMIIRSIFGKANSIKIVRLPKGKDVTEWKKLGGTKEEFLRLVQEAPLVIEADIEIPNPTLDSSTEEFGGEGTQNEDGDGSKEKKKKDTQAKLLVQSASAASLFHAPAGDCYASVPVDNHTETYPIRSRPFRLWLQWRFYTCHGRPPAAQTLQDVLALLEAKARFEGPEIPVFTRMAQVGSIIYIDLGDKDWKAVEITLDGWQVISNPPVKFHRKKGMLALPKPTVGGSFKPLRKFINVDSDDGWRLIVSWMIAAVRPRGPYPVLRLEGSQDSAKTTTGRIIRSLIDPFSAGLRSLPPSERDLMISAVNSWVLAFDNLSHVPDWLSDAFCRLATGGGLATRELFTDSDEILFEAMRPIILNGIVLTGVKQDLLDRLVTVNLLPISDDKRLDEDVLWQEFELIRPQVFGAICDAVSTALKNYSHIVLPRKPRMADFAKWVVAAEEILPWKPGEFLAAYRRNRMEAVEVALESDPVTKAMIDFVDKGAPWEGTASELLKILVDSVPDELKNIKSWPKTPGALGIALRRAEKFLKAVGLIIEFRREAGSRSKRLIAIRKVQQNTVASDASAANCDSGGGKCDVVEVKTVAEKPLSGAHRDGCDGGDGKKQDFSEEEGMVVNEI